MLLIEGRDERFVNELGEQNRLWYRVGVQRRRLRCRKSASFNGFLRRRGRLCFYDIGLREFSGLMRPVATSTAIVDDVYRLSPGRWSPIHGPPLPVPQNARLVSGS